MNTDSQDNIFNLQGRVAVITGGAGLLGREHAIALARYGARPVLIDLHETQAQAVAQEIEKEFGVAAIGLGCDITDEKAVQQALETCLDRFNQVDILINNAANNPKMENSDNNIQFSRLENFPLDMWQADIAVGLTGAFLCSRIFGKAMADSGKGVIINVASDLGLIAPDQRIYRNPELPEDSQPVKPVTYSVVKAGLIGLTRYLASYWPDKVRANAIAPGGVEAGQDPAFISRLTSLIPMGRMARRDEYQAAILFLASDASSYMTGAILPVDGGRTAW